MSKYKVIKQQFGVVLCMLSYIISIKVLCMEDGLIGLGGFIQVSTDLNIGHGSDDNDIIVDLSKVQVELLTDTGIRKFVTDCTPNGYFYMQIENPGFYIVRPRGSIGWSFTPSWRRVECGTSMCNGDKDVNFEVNGFSVKGKIATGCDKDLEIEKMDTILLTLKKQSSSSGGDFEKTVYCKKDGSFEFLSIMPQKYVLYASHPYWELEGPGDGIPLEVSWEAKELEETYSIKGFEIKGSVFSKSEPVSNVHILLHCQNCLKSKLKDKKYCSNQFEIDKYKDDVVCVVETNFKGEFVFHSVPCGEYTLTANYVKEHTSFYLSPETLKIKINGDVHLNTAFNVAGFSARGRVLHGRGDGKTNEPIGHAMVKLNGQDITRTDDNGNYIIPNINVDESMVFDLTATKEDMKFQHLFKVEISPLNSMFPNLYATHYAVCGHIKTQPLKLSQEKRMIIYISDREEYKDTYTDKNGRYCFMLEPGMYKIKVEFTNEDIESGFVLGPEHHDIEIINSPLYNIDFLQKRISIKVEIERLIESDLMIGDDDDIWQDVKVYLNERLKANKDGSDYRDIEKLTIDTKDPNKRKAHVLFDDLIPGKYNIKVTKATWCFQRFEILETVLEDKTFNFQQKGFLKHVKVSHPAEVTIFKLKTESTPESIVKKKYEKESILSICLEPNEPVKLSFYSKCFAYQKETLYLSYNMTKAAYEINPLYYKTSGLIIGPLNHKLNNIEVEILFLSKRKQKKVIAKPIQDGSNVLKYELSGLFDESTRITPRGDNLFFTPISTEIKNSIDKKTCPEEISDFHFKIGLFISGNIIPSVSNVNVNLYLSNGDLKQKTVTDVEGYFKLGPFIDDEMYDVKIEKFGYEFNLIKKSIIDYGLHYEFESKKLSKIEVEVVIDGIEKDGILVVLTGGDAFRETKHTDKDGKVIFLNCPTSSKEYYVKPMLKEYEFTPSSHSIKIRDGQDEKIAFNAKKTSFSIYGKIKTLNKKAIGDVLVEASGPNDRYETATSNDNGSYRIRGLQPNIEYEIKVIKQNTIELWWPYKQIVSVNDNGEVMVHTNANDDDEIKTNDKLKDKKSIDFIVYRNSGVYTISGNVNVDEEYLNSTIIEVYKVSKEGIISKPFLIESCDVIGWFEFEIKIFGHYVIRPKNKYLSKCQGNRIDFKIKKETREREKFIGTLDFDCGNIENVFKKSEEKENSSSMIPVILTIIVILIIQFRHKIKAFISGT